MKKSLVTILVCSISTFLFAEISTNNSTPKKIAVMNSTNIIIKVMSYNVLEGAYPAGPPSYMSDHPAYSNKDRSKEIIKFIKSKNPDILLLQECNHWVDHNKKRLNRFSKELGMPYKALAPNHGHYNVAVLSKFPILDYNYLDDNVEYYWNILTTKIQLTPSNVIDVASTHFGWWGMPGYRGMTEKEKKKTYITQKAFLMDYLKKHLNGKLIIGADWNSNATQSPFGQGNLHDDIAALGYGKNSLNKFHPKLNPIDNIYFSQSGKFSLLDCKNFPEAKALSDHLPLMAEISVTQPRQSNRKSIKNK